MFQSIGALYLLKDYWYHLRRVGVFVFPIKLLIISIKVKVLAVVRMLGCEAFGEEHMAGHRLIFTCSLSKETSLPWVPGSCGHMWNLACKTLILTFGLVGVACEPDSKLP